MSSRLVLCTSRVSGKYGRRRTRIPADKSRIPFDRALDFANKEKITELLYPLFVHNIGALLYHPTNQNRTSQVMAAAERRKQEQQGQSLRTSPGGLPSISHPVQQSPHSMGLPPHQPSLPSNNVPQTEGSFHRRQTFARAIEDIRRAYWKAKLGHEISDVERWTCPCCGKTTGYTTKSCPSKRDETSSEDTKEYKNVVKGRKRESANGIEIKILSHGLKTVTGKGNKKRIVKRHKTAVVKDDGPPHDPNAPSTSTCLV